MWGSLVLVISVVFVLVSIVSVMAFVSVYLPRGKPPPWSEEEP
jgi:hypothetical protein